jgi:Phasin protein
VPADSRRGFGDYVFSTWNPLLSGETRRIGELINAQRDAVGLNRGGRPRKTGSSADPVISLEAVGSEFISQLTSIKEPVKLIELQSEYAKNAYETFVTETKRISELYADLFKQTTKPFENLIAKDKAA